jgi:hypothetical protein
MEGQVPYYMGETWLTWTRPLQSPLQHRMEIIFLSPDCQAQNLVSLLLSNCTDPTPSCDFSPLLR